MESSMAFNSGGNLMNLFIPMIILLLAAAPFVADTATGTPPTLDIVDPGEIGSIVVNDEGEIVHENAALLTENDVVGTVVPYFAWLGQDDDDPDEEIIQIIRSKDSGFLTRFDIIVQEPQASFDDSRYVEMGGRTIRDNDRFEWVLDINFNNECFPNCGQYKVQSIIIDFDLIIDNVNICDTRPEVCKIYMADVEQLTKGDGVLVPRLQMSKMSGEDFFSCPTGDCDDGVELRNIEFEADISMDVYFTQDKRIYNMLSTVNQQMTPTESMVISGKRSSYGFPFISSDYLLVNMAGTDTDSGNIDVQITGECESDGVPIVCPAIDHTMTNKCFGTGAHGECADLPRIDDECLDNPDSCVGSGNILIDDEGDALTCYPGGIPHQGVPACDADDNNGQLRTRCVDDGCNVLETFVDEIISVYEPPHGQWCEYRYASGAQGSGACP